VPKPPSVPRIEAIAADRSLFLTNRNLFGVTTMADEELEALVSWMREPLFFLREQPCDEQFDDLADEDDDDQ